MTVFTALIPARRASTRLPDKVLADLAGKPMVVHVADRARASGASAVAVATDDAQIARAVEAHGYRALMTRADHPSGTDRLAEAIAGHYWLHSGHGWQYFAADPLITRLSSILQAEPDIFQVGINYRDATTLTGVAAPADTTQTNPGTGRYVLTDTMSHGPTMVDVKRFRASSGNTRFAGATLDEVLCVKLS